MNSSEIRKKYIRFFKSRGHKEIPSALLVPENDPTTLFVTAGMQPLIPYLLGEAHPVGKRLVNSQRCLRTDDIEDVGDQTHQTFFEMLGNWSLGDYFKKEAITWSYEFLTSPQWLNIPKEKLAVSVFAGDNNAPFDEDSYNLWLELGIPKERIARLPKKNNWWGPAGLTGPCGPDTEMFYWAAQNTPPAEFDSDDPTWVELWNNVFMQYFKKKDGSFELLSQKNVDTGMGLERTVAVLSGTSDNYQTDLFLPIIQKIEESTGQKYHDFKKEFRVIADHIKATTFLIKDGVIPSNKLQGYVLRRLLRRAAIKMRSLKISHIQNLLELVDVVREIYKDTGYFDNSDKDRIKKVINEELEKFRKTLEKGLKEIEKIDQIDAKKAFDLYQTYGFPLEITEEIFREKGQEINRDEFRKEFDKHRQLSRSQSAGVFKGGLADHSEKTTKLHTANHLMYESLRRILGKHVIQHGSKITPEKLRFDFSHPGKLTEEETNKVEELVNEQIKKDLPVSFEIMNREVATKTCLGAFGERYPEKCKVYMIGDYSREICGGPHVERIGILKNFRILKQESVASDIQRVYATVED